jgi:DNA-binding MarR family transcriptional regulator
MAASRDPKANLEALGRLDRVIHEPGRLQIVAWLATLEEADFLFLLNETGLTRGNLSSHLGKLEAAGYLSVEKTFVEKIPRTVYRLTDAGRSAFQRYREELLGTFASFG